METTAFGILMSTISTPFSIAEWWIELFRKNGLANMMLIQVC